MSKQSTHVDPAESWSTFDNFALNKPHFRPWIFFFCKNFFCLKCFCLIVCNHFSVVREIWSQSVQGSTSSRAWNFMSVFFEVFEWEWGFFDFFDGEAGFGEICRSRRDWTRSGTVWTVPAISWPFHGHFAAILWPFAFEYKIFLKKLTNLVKKWSERRW